MLCPPVVVCLAVLTGKAYAAGGSGGGVVNATTEAVDATTDVRVRSDGLDLELRLPPGGLQCGRATAPHQGRAGPSVP